MMIVEEYTNASMCFARRIEVKIEVCLMEIYQYVKSYQ